MAHCALTAPNDFPYLHGSFFTLFLYSLLAVPHASASCGVDSVGGRENAGAGKRKVMELKERWSSGAGMHLSGRPLAQDAQEKAQRPSPPKSGSRL